MRNKLAQFLLEIEARPRTEPLRRGLCYALPFAIFLSFCLFHVDGALADLVGANSISGRVQVSQASAVHDGDRTSQDLTWLRTFCPFNSAEVVRGGLGSFPDIDGAFLDRLADFERRLCLRRIAKGELKYLLYQGHHPATEDRALQMAAQCGYLHELAFPRFARAFLILGEDSLRDSDYFRCNPDQHFSDALASMDFAMHETFFRIRNIDRFSPGEGVGNTP